MKIERLKISDLDDIALLEEEIFKDQDPWSKDIILGGLLNEASCFYGIKDLGELIAYYGLMFTYEDCDLLNIGIKPSRQGLGIGRRLIEDAISRAKQMKCLRMHLEVRPSNYKALALYESLGFKSLRIRKNYYENGEDCLEMMKGLNEDA